MQRLSRARLPKATPTRATPLGRKVRLPELALGSVLVVGGGLGSVLWATRSPQQQVLVAATDLHPGDVLSRANIRWASISGEHLEGLSSPEAVIGRSVIVNVLRGAPVQQAVVQQSESLRNDQAEVGVLLAPGDFPPGMAVGDAVTVMVSTAADPTGSLSATALAAPARVVRIDADADSADHSTVVSLVIDRSATTSLAGAQRVRLARVVDVDRSTER